MSLKDVLINPLTLEATVDAKFIDHMGHMNTTWYMYLFDRASWSFLALLGLDAAYMERTGTGAFAAEQRLRYLAELRLGERIQIHTQVTKVGTRSLQFTHFMIDVERGTVAATAENVAVHVDRATRRPLALPEMMVVRARRLRERAIPTLDAAAGP